MAKGPYMGMQLLPPGGLRMEMKQQMKMTPPIAHTIEEVVGHSKPEKPRELDDDVLKVVQAYIGSENTSQPYTDRQILGYIHTQGWEHLQRRDIAYARHTLGIKPSSQRIQHVE